MGRSRAVWDGWKIGTKAGLNAYDINAPGCFNAPMHATKSAKNPGGRVSYSFAEFAEMVGKERTWVYRQVKKGRIRAVTGFGAAMIPASEIERIFGEEVTA